MFSATPEGFVKWGPTRTAEDTQAVDEDVLPIDAHEERIMRHINQNRATCIQGETGCGKSTRVPMFIFNDWHTKQAEAEKRGEEPPPLKVIVTQPRRIACITLAKRVENLMKIAYPKWPRATGYQISGDGTVNQRTKVVFVTTGFLLQVVVNQPDKLKDYTHIVLDEVHERDVDSDLLNLVVKLQMRYLNFRLTIMSATFEGDLFARYFVDHIKHKPIK